MAEEPNVNVEGTAEIPAESLPENVQAAETGETTQVEVREPVDDKGVPLKNRDAEAQRKARSLAKAERELTANQSHTGGSAEDEALRIVERIAEQSVMKRLEPVLARQFLMENPDAADMIEDINRIRGEYPELSSIDKLDVAYKVAKAERQDELIRRRLADEQARNEQAVASGNQASAEGTGRTKAPEQTLESRIAAAGSLKELKELEALLSN